MKKIFLFFVLVLVFISHSKAQYETWNWVFGNKAGLSWQPAQLRSFNATGIAGTPDATLNNLPGEFSNQMNNLEGIFTISDRNGNLLFYSNGISVWKADGTIIYSLLNGHDSSAQSGIALPYPGEPRKYICIGMGQMSQNSMGYVIVKANSPTDVTIEGSQANFSGHQGVLGESMTSVSHANGEDWWIVAPGKGSPASLNAWKATTSGGIMHTAPVITSTTINIAPNTANGYMKFTPDGKHFVYATWNDKKLIVGDFDNMNGTFSNIKLIENHSIYGVEFSPDQRYLYTADTGYSSSAPGWYIWDLEALLQGTTTTHLKYIVPDATSNYTFPAGLQMDIDGRIWGTVVGNSRNLFLIDNPDDVNNLRTYKLENFLTVGEATRGLPSFSASLFYQPPLTGPEVVCMRTQQTYTLEMEKGVAANELSTIEWNFGDGTAPVTDSTFGITTKSHTYKKEGTYTIVVKVFLKSDGSEVTERRQSLKVKVNPCVMPVNPNIHLY